MLTMVSEAGDDDPRHVEPVNRLGEIPGVDLPDRLPRQRENDRNHDKRPHPRGVAEHPQAAILDRGRDGESASFVAGHGVPVLARRSSSAKEVVFLQDSPGCLIAR